MTLRREEAPLLDDRIESASRLPIIAEEMKPELIGGAAATNAAPGEVVPEISAEEAPFPVGVEPEDRKETSKASSSPIDAE